MGKVILVTGANGFIGKRLIERLVDTGEHEIIATGRGPEWASKGGKRNFQYIQAELGRPEGIGILSSAAHYDAVIHLAARVNLRDEDSDRMEMYRSNITATHQILELARGQGSHIIFTSTGMVYGDQPGPFREDMSSKPGNFYALSKLLCEEMIRFYAVQYGLKHTLYRTSIVYGPGQPLGMFIPSVIAALVAGQEFPMTAGKQIRDFLYIDDCVRALEMSLEKSLEGTFNLASGVGSTLEETGKLAGEATGAIDKLRIGALPYRTNELWAYFMDISKLTETLGWRPSVSLKAGLAKVTDYARQKRK